MPAVVGIDLGTSNTVVAHADERGARAIVDPSGRTLIPSVISFHPSRTILVGYPARERRIIDSKNTISSVKRLIGRTWGSPEVEAARKRLPYDLRAGRNRSVQVLAREELYSLPEISAFVLRKAKAAAEAALGTRVDRAVITVPANFNDLQREATKLSGALAGLDVLRILNEPTAAALAYGFMQAGDQRVLVYDFGGGTFDVTLLQVKDGMLRVLATAGDMFLGGEDIDTALANKISDAFLRKHHYDPRANREVFQLVRDAAEVLKMQLSVKESAQLDVHEIMVGLGGKAINFSFSMTRAELTQLVTPYVDRTISVCQRALAVAGWQPHDVEQLILVGGSTRLTSVADRVATLFGRAPALGVSPDDAVALGAAIQATALAEGASPHRGSAIARAAREAVLVEAPPPPSPAAAPRRSPPAPPRKPEPAPIPQRAPERPQPQPSPHVAPHVASHVTPPAPVPAPPPASAPPAYVAPPRAPVPPPPSAPRIQAAPAFTPALFAPVSPPPRRRAATERGAPRIPLWVWLLAGFLIALATIIAAGVMLIPTY